MTCCIKYPSLICPSRKGSLCCKASSVTPRRNSTCSLSTCAHMEQTELISGSDCGANSASLFARSSESSSALRGGSCQYRSQIHSPPKMCTSVLRTDPKPPPRSFVNCSIVSADPHFNTRSFAQRSYSKSSSIWFLFIGVTGKGGGSARRTSRATDSSGLVARSEPSAKNKSVVSERRTRLQVHLRFCRSLCSPSKPEAGRVRSRPYLGQHGLVLFVGALEVGELVIALKVPDSCGYFVNQVLVVRNQ